MICLSILLHREDLLPKIIEDTDYSGNDAVIEELLKFFLLNRPELDHWVWEKPYKLLLDPIDNPDPEGRAIAMKKRVKNWYPGIKGKVYFWGKHEQISEAFSPYSNHWAMCAAAFTYLYDIDDKLYRGELVYPKDLVDFARIMPRNAVTAQDDSVILKVFGGQACQKDDAWFTPAKQGGARRFKKGDVMPIFPASEYGETIWQWMND